MKAILLLVAIFAACAFAARPHHLARRMQQQQGCALCEFVVQTVEGFVTSNSSEAQILNFLNRACTLLPDPYSGQCLQIVAAKGPELIQWIIEKENPQLLCQQLTLCPPSVGAKAAIDLAMLSQGFELPKQQAQFCTVCQFVVSTVEGYVNNNATVNKIEAGLSKVCAKLPTTYSAMCMSLVNQVPQIVEWLQEKEQPLTVCQQLKLC